jgi:GTP-sensing pleiotropic transcriptional regulator CodY
MTSAAIVDRKKDHFTIQISVPYGKSMLESENHILEKLNEAGSVMTGEVLSRFDTDGSPIVMGDVKWTSKGKISKPYQTPYGEVEVERHVYQTSKGGRTFCPLERDARIILTATPRFAKIISSKCSEMGSSRVLEDMEGNHGRKVARSFMQNVCDAIGAVVFAKEESWKYSLPEMEKSIHSVSIGMDGTCMLITEDGFTRMLREKRSPRIFLHKV